MVTAKCPYSNVTDEYAKHHSTAKHAVQQPNSYQLNNANLTAATWDIGAQNTFRGKPPAFSSDESQSFLQIPYYCFSACQCGAEAPRGNGNPI